MTQAILQRRSVRRIAARRGIITLWTILAIPLLLTIICVVAEVGHLWQARVQLENALEAAALAAVQEWVEQGGQAQHIPVAEAVGQAYARANTVQGRPVELSQHAHTAAVQWRFGRAVRRGSAYDFSPQSQAPQQAAVLLQASVKVPALFHSVLGGWIRESIVSAQTAAYFDPTLNPPRARLIRIH